jgi:uncharacterized DUF497 family protein
MSLVFEWDTRKVRFSFRKHGVSFAKAISVSNPMARIFPDDEHSFGESRKIIPRPRQLLNFESKPLCFGRLPGLG